MKINLSEIKQLVGANEFELALDKLNQLQSKEQPDIEPEITQLRGRLNKLAQDRINGVLSPTDDQLINNQIRSDLLQLISAYEKNEKGVGGRSAQDDFPPGAAKNVVNIKNNFGDINLS